MSSRSTQRRARQSRNSVEAPRVNIFEVSEDARMFGSERLGDSDDSSVALDFLPKRSSRAPHMQSIISGDESVVSSDDVSKVATGENTAQGAKKPVPEESKNGNPFMDDSIHSNYSENGVGLFANDNPFDAPSKSNRSNRVGPFETSDEDYMLEEGDEEHEIGKLEVEDINVSNGSGGGLLGMVNSSKNIYEGAMDHTTGANKKGYYNLSKTEDRQIFMSNMSGVGGQPPEHEKAYHSNVEAYYNDEEDQADGSPLYKDDSTKLKSNSTAKRMGLSQDNPFYDNEDSSLDIMTHTTSFIGSKGKYASMQELLDESNASPLVQGNRKGMSGCIDKTFGGKKTKRRKITIVAIVLLFFGVFGAVFYVVIGIKPADSNKIEGFELVVLPTSPTQSPSSATAKNPIGPSFFIPSFVLNGSLTDSENIFNATTEGSLTNATTSSSPLNSTNTGSEIFNTYSPAPTISSIFDASFSPSKLLISSDFNSSFTPTPQPSVVSENNTINIGIETNTTNELIKNVTAMTNETMSLVPTTAETIMPSFMNDVTNETISQPSPAPFIINTIMPSVSMNETTMPSFMNDFINETITPPSPVPFVINTIMPSVSVNETTNLTYGNDSIMPTSFPFETINLIDGNQSIVPTPAPYVNVTDSIMPSIQANENESPAPTSTPPTPALSNSPKTQAPILETKAPVSTTESFLDELSDPWTLYKSFQHNEPSALFGTSLAFSAEPTLFVVGAKDSLNEVGDAVSGAAYVYSFDKNGTSSLLQVIYGKNDNDEFGSAIAISDDGRRLVIGSRSEASQSGAARVFSFSESSYSQLGDTIIGTIESGRTGWSVAISGDGSTVAIGSPKGGSEGGGSVLIYQYNGDAWVTIGSEIAGSTSEASVGYSVSLNSDGSILAVGNPKARNRDGFLNAGKVATYAFIDDEWELAGEVFGQSSEDVEGTSIALSPNGEFLVTGSKGRNGDDGNIESAGACQLYQNLSGRRWRSRNTLMGQSEDEHLGSWVTISRDASVFACGGINGVLQGLTYGVVRTWNRRTSIESAIWPRSENPAQSAFGYSLSFSPIGLAIGAPDFSGGDGGSLTGVVEIFSYNN